MLSQNLNNQSQSTEVWIKLIFTSAWVNFKLLKLFERSPSFELSHIHLFIDWKGPRIGGPKTANDYLLADLIKNPL